VNARMDNDKIAALGRDTAARGTNIPLVSGGGATG